MFEKWFAKYARAVSDDRERERLYKKYRAKTVASIIFSVLCIAMIALAYVLEPYIEEEWAFTIMTVLIFAWLGFGIAGICLWISFRRTYNSILKRSAYSGEMPEVTAYRQKVVDDKKSTFQKLWWAWVIFGICVVGFIVCMVMETIQNPDGEEPGVWGIVSFFVLLAGALTIAFAYIIRNTIQLQQGKTFEQQTEREVHAIDKAQGRKHEYDLQADPNLQTYKYLFPNKQLYAEAEEIRKKYFKATTIGITVLAIISVVVILLLLLPGIFSGNTVPSYVVPLVFTLLFGGAILCILPMNSKLTAVEKKQKAELESNPAYALNLKWYRLYENFQKFKGKVLPVLIAFGIVLGWVLAIIFPDSAWELLMFIPMVIGLLLHNKFVKELRQEAIPIESEIDQKDLKWNEMWNLWVQELVDSPYAELMTYQSEVNNGGHAQYFDNVSGTSDLQKEMSALDTILPPQLRGTLKKAYEAQLIIAEKDDEEAEETLRQCDEAFYKNEEEINRILEEYAAKIEL